MAFWTGIYTLAQYKTNDIQLNYHSCIYLVPTYLFILLLLLLLDIIIVCKINKYANRKLKF